MKCDRHPDYNGKEPPESSQCTTCWDIWDIGHRFSNMTMLPESMPYQPIEEDTEEKSLFWAEKALPLVRRVFEELKQNSYEQKKIS